MKKYRVLRDNHGFQGRYWKAGKVVEFDDDVIPPKHFLLLDGSPVVQKIVKKIEDDKAALSQIALKSIKPTPTAGAVLKNQKKAGVPIPAEEF